MLPDIEPAPLGIRLLPAVQLYPPSPSSISSSGCDQMQKHDVASKECCQDVVGQSTDEVEPRISTAASAVIASNMPNSNSDQDEVEFILSVTRKKRRKKKNRQDGPEDHPQQLFNPTNKLCHTGSHQTPEALEFKKDHSTIVSECHSVLPDLGEIIMPVSETCAPLTQAHTLLKQSPSVHEANSSYNHAISTRSREQDSSRVQNLPRFQHRCVAAKAIPISAKNISRKRKQKEEDHLIDPELRKIDGQMRETQQQAVYTSQLVTTPSSYATLSAIPQLQVSNDLPTLNKVFNSPNSEPCCNQKPSTSTFSNDHVRRPSLYSIPEWQSSGPDTKTVKKNSSKEQSFSRRGNVLTVSAEFSNYGFKGPQKVDIVQHWTPYGQWIGCSTGKTIYGGGSQSPGAFKLQTNTLGCSTDELYGPSADVNVTGCAGNDSYGSFKQIRHHGNQPHGLSTKLMSNPVHNTSNSSIIAHGTKYNSCRSSIISAGTSGLGGKYTGTAPYYYIPQLHTLPQRIHTHSFPHRLEKDMPSQDQNLQCLLVDIAQTAQHVFPFQDVARRHNTSMQRVFDTFSAVIQLPLLRSAADSRKQGSLSAERLNDFRASKKEIQEKHKAVRKVTNKSKQVTPAKRGRPLKTVKLTEARAVVPKITLTPTSKSSGTLQQSLSR